MRKFIIGVLALIGLVVVLAAVFFFANRRGELPLPVLQETYANAQSDYADLPGGVRMHYRDQGNEAGPTILLVHGFSASLHTWEPWVAELGDRYRLVSLDLPGHGLTAAPADYQASIAHFVREVEAFTQARGLERFTIVGSSMGGNVAWEYALAHPEQMEALVLVGASGWPDVGDEAGDEPVIFKLMRNPAIAPLLSQIDNSRLIRQGLEASFADPALVDDAMVARYAEQSRMAGHRAILRQMMLGHRERRQATNEIVGAIAVPTLILHGAQDNLVPVAHGRQFAAAIPGSELIVWDDDGHLPQEEHPERSAEALAGFLARVHASHAAATAAQQSVTDAP